MSVPKVLIVDPEDAFRECLTRAMEVRFQVAACTDGQEALEKIRSWEPDAVIMELTLPSLDGVGLLRAMESLERVPRVMVVTYQSGPFVWGVLESLSVAYAMLKPAKVSTVVSRTGELLESGADAGEYGELPEILSRLGLRSGRQGYQDLLVGIPMLARQRNQRLGKELYDAIARENQTTAKAVEKAIRDVLKDAWKSGQDEMWQRLFPGVTQCPANKEFLFRLADLVSMYRKCG